MARSEPDTAPTCGAAPDVDAATRDARGTTRSGSLSTDRVGDHVLPAQDGSAVRGASARP